MNTDGGFADVKTAMSAGFAEVKKAFESTYKCLGITCAQVGGLLLGDPKYYEGAEPCKDHDDHDDHVAPAADDHDDHDDHAGHDHGTSTTAEPAVTDGSVHLQFSSALFFGTSLLALNV